VGRPSTELRAGRSAASQALSQGAAVKSLKARLMVFRNILVVSHQIHIRFKRRGRKARKEIIGNFLRLPLRLSAGRAAYQRAASAALCDKAFIASAG